MNNGIIVVSPILESAMKSTMIDKIKSKFIALAADDPEVMEAAEEVYNSTAFVDGNFNNGNYDKNVSVNTENVKGYIRGSRLKELMEICDYTIMIDKPNGGSYTAALNKDGIENLDDNHMYIFYAYKDTLTVGDMSLYAELKSKFNPARKVKKVWLRTKKDNRLTNKARNRLYRSMIFIDACYDDVTNKTNCTSCFRKPIKGKLCKRYLNHCKYPGIKCFKNNDNDRYYILVKYYDALEMSEVYYLYGKCVAKIHDKFRVIY